MDNCIFCKIVNGEIESNKVFEDESVLAFYDINKEAPVHVVIIPKKHIESLNSIEKEDGVLLAHLINVIKEIADKLGLKESGYRIVNNCGKDGGQTVPHLHFHLLGGRTLNWPPG